MNRYKDISVVLDGKKKVYSSVMLPEIPIDSSDVYVMAIVGDRLDVIAHKYYNDATMWWVIAHANKIKNSIVISEAIQLRIPMSIDKINRLMKEMN